MWLIKIYFLSKVQKQYIFYIFERSLLKDSKKSNIVYYYYLK